MRQSIVLTLICIVCIAAFNSLQAQDIVGRWKTVDDEKRMHFQTDGFYFKSPQEMQEAFRELPEVILNTRAIAERCHVEFTLGASLLPKYELQNGQ